MELAHDLPTGVAEWVAAVGGGELSRLDRAVARRVAWLVDVRRPDGSTLQGFLRLARTTEASDLGSLAREASIVEALAGSDVPVPRVHGRSEDLQTVLYERVPGRSDLDKLDDIATQHAVMRDFMRVIGQVHNLDVDDLGLDGVVPSHPTTPEECALGEVDLMLAQGAAFLAGYTEPLLTFGVDWLRRNVPASIERVSLVQGDTGPVNFMFDGDHVSAVIDWEWGHLGDPMEDLGNICVREFWNPSGGLTGMFDLYAKESGIAYSRSAAQYYRVQQQVRGMVGIHAITTNGARPSESLAWMLTYRYVGDRATCEAIADAMDLELVRPDLPDADEDGAGVDILAIGAQHVLDQFVQPAVGTPFARSCVKDVGVLVQCMDRRRRYGAMLEETERAELAVLLGEGVGSARAGLTLLDAALHDGTVDHADALRYLARRAYRDEWLHSPAVTLYPERNWSAID